MTGSARRAVGAIALVALLAACDPPQPVVEDAPQPVVEDAALHPVLEAVARSREAGSARTETVAPPGVTPQRVTGVVDFRTGRSDTLVEVLRDDGTAIPYGRVVRTPEVTYAGMYLGRDEPAWRRVDPDTVAEGQESGFMTSGLLVLDAIEEQHGALRADSGPGRGRTYVRPGPPPTGPDNVLGLVILSFTLDGEARVGETEYTLPAMREHVFVMRFTGYGEAPPVEVPQV